jgi:hypothetical protein
MKEFASYRPSFCTHRRPVRLPCGLTPQQFYSGFRQTYKCLPMTAVRPELEDGGKST